MLNRTKIYFTLSVCLIVFSVGCAARSGNKGNVQQYVANMEAEWIRNGEPIVFENESWYPVDGIESLIDTEVMPVVEYKGVTVFIDKVDVRPYNRLYTKFGINKYRYFKTKQE
ncbi:MAG: hypothetical protein KBD53_06135 [Candidatus Omnitrophica bacterium]|nr:hypothetical protein [Candidatus Omnitrophota bacterium]